MLSVALVLDGVTFNADLRNTYGPDVMILEVEKIENDVATGGIAGSTDSVHIGWV